MYYSVRQKGQVEKQKKTHLSQIRSFMPRGGPLGGGTVLESDLPSFGIRTRVTLLSVRFLERSGGKCRDRGAFGWDADYVSGADITPSMREERR